MMKVNYMLDYGAYAPIKAHEADAGFDLKLPKGGNVTVAAHDSAIIDTGIHVAIPTGYVGFLKSKSGLNVKQGLRGEGVIDAGYTGSIVVKLYNDSDKPYYFFEGDKIIQLVILPIPNVVMGEVDSFDWVETERGDNGFGSSGK